MPCVFTFVDMTKKGVCGRALRTDCNYLFMLDWLAVFGWETVTAKESAVPWIPYKPRERVIGVKDPVHGYWLVVVFIILHMRMV